MDRITDASARPYDSPLRDAQQRATRSRILDAALRVISGGIASVSMPAVAREAGVSVPTVYRHFRTKAELMAAVYPHVAARTGLDRLPDPTSLDDLSESLRAIFARVDALDDLDRAAMASPGADEVRHATMPRRLARIGGFTDAVGADLPPDARARITRLMAVLTASASLRMWRRHLGASVEQAADDIDFAIRAALAASRRSQP
ncbi:MAG TPA: helix-turn-helix domain-containing protein [Candidatus Limnocylindria bacterium]|jgi:AcrR family transcriptional regulator|nr:helix-turn-helix domain-containing protein [Candidatus Limnocylindria bacterium]